MKFRRSPFPLLAVFACISSHAAATNQYWNIGSTGGDGIWGTGPGDKNWNLTPGAAAGNTTRTDPTDNIAVLQDSVGGGFRGNLISATARGRVAYSRVTFNRMKPRGWPPAGSLKQCSPSTPVSGKSCQLPGSNVALHSAP